VSIALHKKIVRFQQNGSGVVKDHDYVRQFTIPPRIPGLPEFEWCEWIPYLKVAEIKPKFEARRELYGNEIFALIMWVDTLKDASINPNPGVT
jgi:hypothetical protein